MNCFCHCEFQFCREKELIELEQKHICEPWMLETPRPGEKKLNQSPESERLITALPTVATRFIRNIEAEHAGVFVIWFPYGSFPWSSSILCVTAVSKRRKGVSTNELQVPDRKVARAKVFCVQPGV